MKDYADIFEQSLARAIGGGEYNHEFIASFYDAFISESDEIARLFENTDMAAQLTMLHDSLTFLVDFCKTGKVNPVLERIAGLHGRGSLNIPASLYDAWLESLILAARKFDAQFDERVELAWRLVLAPGITYMKFQASNPGTSRV